MLVPSRLFVWVMALPLLLAVATLFERELLRGMLLVDAGIAVVALFDAMLAWRPQIRVRRSVPNIFSLGRANSIKLELDSSAQRQLQVEIRDDLFAHATSADLPVQVKLAAGGHAKANYHVFAYRRGQYRLGDHHIRYPSPLGLWLRQIKIPAQNEIRVYPDVQAVRNFEMLARQDRDHAGTRVTRIKGGQNEFEALREYQRDDEFRSLDWKATARRGKLIARQYQLERDQSIVFMLDGGRLMTAEVHDLSLFDHALNASLLLAHIAARGGDHTGFLAFADQLLTYLPPASERRAAKRLIQATFALHPQLVEADFSHAFRQLSTRLRKRSLVIIFTQVIDQKASRELLMHTRSLLPRHLPLCVLFRDAGVEALATCQYEEDGQVKADAFMAAAAAEVLSERDQLIRELKRAGVLVLDVKPEQLTPQLIRQYLQIKALHLL